MDFFRDFAISRFRDFAIRDPDHGSGSPVSGQDIDLFAISRFRDFAISRFRDFAIRGSDPLIGFRSRDKSKILRFLVIW